jgi:AmmeMemoRadiSam system protein B
MREAVAAGSFYPLDSNAIEKKIISCFKSKLGPKKLPGKAKKERFTVAVVPHAGYDYSGPCASHVYKKLAESQKPDVIVIVGTNHSGMGPSVSVFTKGDWQTPIGIAKVDAEFAALMIKGSKFAREDEFGHKVEHSIEVQLPFLQHIYKDFKFVPIVLKGLHVFQETEDLADAIISTAKMLKKHVLVIASSDLTHYGPGYNYTPFKGSEKHVKEQVKKMDEVSISKIEKLDEVGFLKHIIKTNSTVCGYPAITLAITFAKKKGLKKMNLLKYYTSGEISGDFENFVGYASMIA